MKNITRMNRFEAKRRKETSLSIIETVLTWIGYFTATSVLFKILAICLNMASQLFMKLHEFMVFINSYLNYLLRSVKDELYNL